MERGGAKSLVVLAVSGGGGTQGFLGLDGERWGEEEGDWRSERRGLAVAVDMQRRGSLQDGGAAAMDGGEGVGVCGKRGWARAVVRCGPEWSCTCMRFDVVGSVRDFRI